MLNMPNPKSNLDMGIHLRPAVYVLLLQGGRRYVGISLQLSHRLSAHWTGLGATATKTYRPIRVERVVYPATVADERRITLELMRDAVARHGADGWTRVFGSDWCKLFRRHPPREIRNSESSPTPRQAVTLRADSRSQTAAREENASLGADARSG